MFKPKTEKLKILRDYHDNRIKQLSDLFFGRTNIYIDYANIRPWANKLGWHIDLKFLFQFLGSFESVGSIKIYRGTLLNNTNSKKDIEMMEKIGYDVKTKPVKIMKHSIDVTSIYNLMSQDLLENFIRRCLLKRLDLETIEYLNKKFRDMNKGGEYFIKDLKCNFDVEIGRDMLLDYERNCVDVFALWSGDSDFADPVEQLLRDGKRVILFATSRRIAAELGELSQKGLIIFDIQKIRNFICWKKEIEENVKTLLNAK